MAPRTVQRGVGISPVRHIQIDDVFNALPSGSAVLTLDGALPVDYLAVGDRVITRDGGMAVLRSVRRHHARLAAVTIRGGAFGHMRPDQEIVLPATQEILLRDWRAKALFGASRALVPASRLVDGTFVRALGPVEMTWHALSFDQPHILYADGLELASACRAAIAA